MWSVESHLGRLVEVKIKTGFHENEVEAFVRAIVDKVNAQGEPVLGVADIRECTVLTPTATEMIIAMMRCGNPLVMRTAILLPQSSVLNMQWTRMTERAGGNRKLFADPEPLCAWLSEVANPVEMTQCRTFLELPPERRREERLFRPSTLSEHLAWALGA
jgi:hypothetical protein